MPKTEYQRRQRVAESALLLLTAFFLMTVCSMASPLFAIHTGVDQNTFLTVGRSMCEGRVLYRDIFEQKGPLLYLLHALAYLTDSDGFTGVWVLEILSFWWYLSLLRRIALELVCDRLATPAAMLTGLLTAVSYAFSRGDNAEEFCLPLLAVGLLGLLRYTERGEKTLPLPVLLGAGACAGCVLWIKFTMLGFYIAWVLCVFVISLRRGGFRRAVTAVLWFLCGMLLVTLPWLIYFAAHDALGAFWDVYFYANIFLYSGQTGISARLLSVFTKDFAWNPPLFLAILAGVVWVRRAPLPLRPETRRAVLATWFTLYFFLFAGGTRYRYYFLIMALFAVFGVIALLRPLAQRQLRAHTAVLLCVCGGALAVLTSNCRSSLLVPRDAYPQYQFAAEMGETPSLLNYRFLDGGFYLAAEAPLPDIRYVCTLNIPRDKLPEQFDAQDALIETAAVKFVVTRYRMDGDAEGKEPPCAALAENYQCVKSAEDAAAGYGYRLFRRRTD